MILIDTSAWVEFLRDTGSGVCERVEELLDADVATCDPVRMEVLAEPGMSGTCTICAGSWHDARRFRRRRPTTRTLRRGTAPVAAVATRFAG